MKGRISRSLAFCLITSILFRIIADLPGHGWVGSNNIYLTPSTNNFDTSTTLPCHKFQVTIWAENLPTPVKAWQVRLNIIPAGDWINITNAWLATADPEYIFSGSTTGQPTPALQDNNCDGCHDSAKVGDILQTGTPVTGYGPFKLAVVEFHLTKAPGKCQPPFSAELNTDNADTYLLDENMAEISPIIKNIGSVTYSWKPPATNPYMAVEPDYLLFEENTLWTDPANSDFTVDIYIKNLELGWSLHNASFDLIYDGLLLDPISIVFDPAWAGPNNFSLPTRGTVRVFVQGHPAPAGDILVATITFRIVHQGLNPPQQKTEPNATDLTFSDVTLWNTFDTIPTESPLNGKVTVEPYLTGECPWFEVVPSNVTLGPGLVMCEQYGQEFEVNIDIKNLASKLRLVGVELRLCYNPEILEVLKVVEGPFLQDPSWDWYGTYTIVIYPEPPNQYAPCAHILLGDVILPNATGHWDQPSPHGEGTIFTVRFRPLQQSWTETLEVDLTLLPIFPGEYGVDVEGEAVCVQENLIKHGLVTILPIKPEGGRQIDVWFTNPPNNGYGIHQPADVVVPQTDVELCAKVTYNCWPVQYKKVTFEVRDNNGVLWAVLQDDTGEEGHACVSFRMPWPCEGAEDLLGRWNVTASVTLADVVISDYVTFYYDYLIRIWSLTTDKAEYGHCEDVEITVEYGTRAMRDENVTLAVTMTDELGVPIAVDLVELTVGGASFCSYKNCANIISLHIEKFAYAGLATVHVSFLNALPSEGGEAVAQEVTTTFWILPH